MARTSRKPTRAELRVARRREYFRARLARAEEPRDRIAVAIDYLQAVLAAADHGRADATAARVTEHLLQIAEDTQKEAAR